MATSLKDIPGAKGRGPRRRQRDTWQGLTGRGRPTVLVDPRQALGRPARQTGTRRRTGLFDSRRPRLSPFDTALLLAALAVALFLAKGLWDATRVDVRVAGLRDGESLTFEKAAELAIRISVDPASRLPSAVLTFDGEEIDAEKLDDGYRWAPGGPLAAGQHRLELTVPRPVLPESRHTWTFQVDATPPQIVTKTLLEPRGLDEPVRISGTVDADAELTANGEAVDTDDDGRFEISYDHPPAGPILLQAVDAAGHVEKKEVFVPVTRPSVRGVHMTAISWRVPELRNQVLRLIDEGKINAVELDLKDEGGEVGYDSELALPTEIGAVKKYYDLDKAVDELHARGVRVVGRLVAFRDPILAEAAWARGDKSWVVQRPDGSAHGAYGGFTNLAHAEVQRYNIDIAMEAVAAGVDEILWDYIRRPEGDPAEIVFPGLEGSVENGVWRFLQRTHGLLRDKGVYQGASLFGIAADRPGAVGQNVPRIARHVDYISPMVYPSLWVPGEYRVPDPTRMPGEIVKRSLEDFQKKAAGTGVHFTPWLQDFSLGAEYGDREVRAQIDAARSLGIDDFLLWSPRVRYHAALLDRA